MHNPLSSPEWRPFRLGVLGTIGTLLVTVALWFGYLTLMWAYHGQQAYEYILKTLQQQAAQSQQPAATTAPATTAPLATPEKK